MTTLSMILIFRSNEVNCTEIIKADTSFRCQPKSARSRVLRDINLDVKLAMSEDKATQGTSRSNGSAGWSIPRLAVRFKVSRLVSRIRFSPCGSICKRQMQRSTMQRCDEILKILNLRSADRQILARIGTGWAHSGYFDQNPCNLQLGLRDAAWHAFGNRRAALGWS